MANSFANGYSPAAAAANRRPMFLPGFDHATQLGMEFKTIRFSTAWLRKTYTTEQARSIQVCLAAEDQRRRERRLQEVRYGNNITLLFKACYAFREFHRSGDLWKAISRVYGVGPEVVKSVVDLFVEARAIFLENYHPGSGTAWVRTTATHWIDQWVLFIDGRDRQRLPSVSDVFAGVKDFFRQEEQATNGDLARILPTTLDAEPPSGPRALRKRSPSPCALESSPVSKRRTISTSTDGTGTQATSVDFTGKEEHLDSVFTTNGRQRADYQPDHKHRDEPFFQLKIRGIHDSPTYQDHPFVKPGDDEDDGFGPIAQYNSKLLARVQSLEKERHESIEAQNDRDNAIRTLQARFTAFEKASAAADTQASGNDKLVQQIQGLTEKLDAQAKKLQKMEKDLESSNQTAHSMQATISSLQEELARRTQPTCDGNRLPGGQTGSAASEDRKIQERRGLEAQKKEFSGALVRIASLEAKSVFFNDLYKTVREMKAEMAAQKDKAKTAQTESTEQPSERVTPARMRNTEEALEKQEQIVQSAMSKLLILEARPDATEKVTATLARLGTTEEALKKQDQTIQRAMERLLVLEDQALKRNARIVSLETRPDASKDIARLWSVISAVDQTQVNNLEFIEEKICSLRTGLDQTQGHVEDLSKRLATELGGLPTVQSNVCEMQTKIAQVEQHGTKISKRLDDMEVSQEAIALQDHSARIDELSQSIEALKAMPVSLAKAADVRAAALRAELKAFCQSQTTLIRKEAIKKPANADDPNAKTVQRLTQRLGTIDWMLEKHMAESREKFDQLLDGAACGRDMGRSGKENGNVAAVVDSLCRRVGIMENGFEVMRDVVCARQR